MAATKPVECVENTTGKNGVVVYDDKTLPLSPQVNQQISVECVENPTGKNGVVVYDDKTLPLSPQVKQQWQDAEAHWLCRFQEEED